MAHTPPIANRPADTLESERLARRWFSIVEQHAFEQLGELVHPSITHISKVRPGLVVEGREDFTRFVREILVSSLYEALPTAFHAIDERRIVVEGRMRWIDEDRVIRDDPVTWAMEFRDGLLIRFMPARTRVEAETILGSPVA